MIRLIVEPLFLLFSLSWIYPIVIFEISRIVKYGYSGESIGLLVIGALFSYLIFNLRRDRLDVSKHYEILSYVKKYEDAADFSLQETSDYIDDSKLLKFINAYGNSGLLSGFVKGKISKFVNNRIRIVLLSPKLERVNKGNINLPSGLKSFPSYITHQTTIFTINQSKKLNPLLRFFINHELGHMHKFALSNVTMREVGTFPFLWFTLWAAFNVEINFYSIFLIALILLIVLFSELKNEDSKMNIRERVDAEIASDYMGLKLLSKEELNHKVFDKIAFTDPDLNEKENLERNEGFRLILSKIRADERYELPNNLHFRKRVILLSVLVVFLSSYVTEPNIELIKYTICLCVFVQSQRLVNHREINRVLTNIHERTGVNLSRFSMKNEENG